MKKNYRFLFLSLVATIILFNSCKKENITKGEVANNVLDINDASFLSWAQANNGRWLPYSIRKSRAQFGNTASPQILNTWSEYMGPVNAAKVYYRDLIQKKTGIGSDKIDIYLDSIYVANYKAINKTLKYQETMDSLFASYKRLNNIRSSRVNNNQSIYVPGQFTNHFKAGAVKDLKLAMQKESGTVKLSAKSKSLMALESGDPDGNVWTSDNCIPAVLTDWFDQQYENIYTKIKDQPGSGVMLAPQTFYNEIKKYNTNECTANLFNSFYEAAMGMRTIYNEDGTVAVTTISCGDMTSTIIEDLFDYYNCINKKMPTALKSILADGDPFEDDLTDVYTTNYQLSESDVWIINYLNQEDYEMNQFASSNVDCHGIPNMFGNIFFQGNREHMAIQLAYLCANPLAEREYWIPQASSAGNGNGGRADLANPITGEIFEIKSRGNGTTSINSGIIEVERYVTKANQFCTGRLSGGRVWHKGTNYTPITIPFSSTQYLQASLYSPGLILYDKVSPSYDPQVIPVPHSIAEKFKKLIERLSSFQVRSSAVATQRIIFEFLRKPENADMVDLIKTAAFTASAAIIVATIAEDIATGGVGIADDAASFALAYRIYRIAYFL